MLIETIQSILSQEFDCSLFEIILVTQNSDLNLDALGFSDIANLKVIHRPVSDTISGLRNIGVTQSQGKYLAFLDADIYLSKNWLSQVVSILESSDYILIGAIQADSDNAPPLEKIRTALCNVVQDCEVQFLTGRNLFLRKSDFDKVGGFPEHLVTCEDYYFTDKISDLGKLFYTSASSYVHLGEDKKFNEMFRKEIWRGQSNILSIRGRKVSVREIPSIISPLLFVLFLSLTLIWAYLDLFVLTFLSFTATCLILILYTVRSKRVAPSEVSILDHIKFYCYYFFARSIGTLWGLIKALKN